MLTIGILAALLLRGVFIALGAALLALFSFPFLIFGAILIFTAVQLFRHRNEDPSIDDNVVVAYARRALPISDRYDGGRLVTRVDGRRMLTPLFLVFLAIGSTDILFALDSIPAIYGITEEPFIVLVANAFALLGLRALYFLVSGLLDRLVYLSTGLSLILAFIGVKLALLYLDKQNDTVPEIATTTSLIVIAAILTATTVASIIKARRDPAARAHAGSLREQEKSRSPHSPVAGMSEDSSEAVGCSGSGTARNDTRRTGVRRLRPSSGRERRGATREASGSPQKRGGASKPDTQIEPPRGRGPRALPCRRRLERVHCDLLDRVAAAGVGRARRPRAACAARPLGRSVEGRCDTRGCERRGARGRSAGCACRLRWLARGR